MRKKGDNMATNTKLLKSKMVLNGDTVSSLAESLGVNRQNMSIKLNGKRDFKQTEIAKIAKRYRLTYQELKEIFLDDVITEEEFL